MDIEQMADDIHRRLVKSGKGVDILGQAPELYKNYNRSEALKFVEKAVRESKYDAGKFLKNAADGDLKSFLYEIMILASH